MPEKQFERLGPVCYDYQTFIDHAGDEVQPTNEQIHRTYRLDVSISEGNPVSGTTEISDCVREYVFKRVQTDKIVAMLSMDGIRYDKEKEREEDREKSRDGALEAIAERASIRNLDMVRQDNNTVYFTPNMSPPSE
jgi:hypothetical protein